ncbi:hypothetical protein BDK51DRAFT_26769 [Blyttiomyces helicus]|uniref:VWFA domain-containing protein n=1 Tax=Blyttiomyces helicus TaxID=388810 RepID=A0A4P9W7N7_9FUNG|nr:hypothetical protein BDK51DRAFT_26769 [Blyttiomyces helicus]|eukprot:RKO87395.1 hypothetical protein BDK51DRAFT_26769 [Blyttiomyces helicus]
MQDADNLPNAQVDLCPICLNPLQLRGGVPLINPGCGHELHVSCFTSLQRSNIAPKCLICRKPYPSTLAPAPIARQRSSAARPAPAPAPAQPPLPADDPVVVRAAPQNGENAVQAPPSIQILAEYSSLPQEITTPIDVNFLVSIKAPDLPEDPLAADPDGGTSTSTSVDLVVVVDTSGSMAGNALATVKNTLLYILSTLDASDRLAIVEFNSSASQITPLWHVVPNNAERFEAAVARLAAGGGTSIPSGLRMAIDVLLHRATSNPSAAVLLLSDGQDDHEGAGSYDSLIASARDVGPIHTFGIGRDHDSRVLSHLAGSSGAFTYIENTNVLRDSFAGCLGAIRSTVFENIRLSISISGPAATGLAIRQIRSGSYANFIDSRHRNAAITIPNMYASEFRDFLLECVATSSPARDAPLVNVGCTYIDLASGQNGSVSSVPIVLGRHQSLTYPNPGATPDPAVVKQRYRLEVADAIKIAIAEADADRYQASRTALLTVRTRLLATVDACVGSTVEDLDAWIKAGSPAMVGMSADEWAFYVALINDIDTAMPLVRDRKSYSYGGRSMASTFQSTHSSQRAYTSTHTSSASTPMYQTGRSRVSQTTSMMFDDYAMRRERPDRSAVGTVPVPPPRVRSTQSNQRGLTLTTDTRPAAGPSASAPRRSTRHHQSPASGATARLSHVSAPAPVAPPPAPGGETKVDTYFSGGVPVGPVPMETAEAPAAVEASSAVHYEPAATDTFAGNQ